MSLCYLLVFLLQKGKVNFIATNEDMSRKEIFHFVRKIKT
jgi:hypothetical protein